jgi:cbb3-type cytochrome oxidase subunit 3
MQSSTSDLESLAARVEKLERQNRLFKGGGLALLLVFVAVVVLAYRTERMRQAQSARFLETRELLLTDAHGVKRAELSANSDTGEPHLIFWDEYGATQPMSLSPGSLEMTGGFISLKDEAGHAIMGMGLDPFGNGTASIDMLDPEGEFTEMEIVNTRPETFRKGRPQQTTGPSMRLFDEGGRVLWSAP